MDQITASMDAVSDPGHVADAIAAQVADYLDSPALIIEGPDAPLRFTNLPDSDALAFVREHTDASTLIGFALAKGMLLWQDLECGRTFQMPNTVAASMAVQFEEGEHPATAWGGPAVLTGTTGGAPAPLNGAAVAAVVSWFLELYPYPELILIK